MGGVLRAAVLPGLAVVLLVLIAGSKWWREVRWERTVVTHRDNAWRLEGRSVWVAEGCAVYFEGFYEWDDVGWSRWGSRVRRPRGIQMVRSGSLYGQDGMPARRALWFETGQQQSNGPGLLYGNRAVRVPLWPLFALCAARPALSVYRWLRSRRFAGRGGCPGCGYDLRHGPQRCPECGRAVGGAGFSAGAAACSG